MADPRDHLGMHEDGAVRVLRKIKIKQPIIVSLQRKHAHSLDNNGLFYFYAVDDSSVTF
jgi:hypothetical protein